MRQRALTGYDNVMQIRRVIRKQIRHDKDGVQADVKVNAVVAVNVGERNAVARAVQRSEHKQHSPRQR